ncbi:hypothetical protein [Streptomyces sp. NPDC020747]|uniref:hypothetical protein n=1 Tax=Streptomyces sp. NPDC020747 TaxID=3365086 RepID=UPI00379022D3
MTLTDLMPRRFSFLWEREQPVRKHRAVDEVDRLKRHLHGAQLLINGLHLQLDDQDHEHEQIIARIDERYTATIRELEDRIAELENRLNVGVLAEAAAAQTQEIPIVPIPVALHQAPFATTNPGRGTPSWAVRDETSGVS